MLTFLKRIIKSGWLNFTRDGGLIAANIFIMVMIISVITSLFILREASQFLIKSLQEKVDISVYFKYEAQEEDILRVKEEIAAMPEVKEIKYVSEEEALKRFVERYKDSPHLMETIELLEGEGINPLRAYLNIRAFEAGQYQTIADLLKGPNFENLIEEIDPHQRRLVIERIFALTANINKFGIGFSIILVIVVILIAFNTTKLAIHNSREEIQIQRLVGASNWFIRGPFLIQGAITGLLSVLICFSLFALVFWIFGPRFAMLFPGLNLFNFFIANFWIILLIQLVTGVGLGIVSSLIAVRRYLAV